MTRPRVETKQRSIEEILTIVRRLDRSEPESLIIPKVSNINNFRREAIRNLENYFHERNIENPGKGIILITDLDLAGRIKNTRSKDTLDSKNKGGENDES